MAPARAAADLERKKARDARGETRLSAERRARKHVGARSSCSRRTTDSRAASRSRSSRAMTTRSRRRCWRRPRSGSGEPLGTGRAPAKAVHARQVRQSPPERSVRRAPRPCWISSRGFAPSTASSRSCSAELGAPAPRPLDRGAVVLERSLAARRRPAELAAEDRGDVLGGAPGPGRARRGSSGTRRAQHVRDLAGVLGARGVDDLGPEVRQLGIDPARRARAPRRSRPARRRRARRTSPARCARTSAASSCIAERGGWRAAARAAGECGVAQGPIGALDAAAAQQLDDTSTACFAHPAQRRQLAARDRRRGRRARAGSRARARSPKACARWWRAAAAGPRRSTSTSSGAEAQAGERVVGRLEQVGDVLAARADLVVDGAAAARRRPVGVGGADDGARARRAARRTGGCRAASAAPARGPGAARARRRTPGARPASGAGGARPSVEKASVNGPVALSTTRARASKRRAGLGVDERGAGDAAARDRGASDSTRRWLATAAPAASASSDVLEHQPRVVGLAVDVGHRAGQAGGAQVRAPARRASPRRQLAGRARAGARARARCRARCPTPSVRQAGRLAAVAREDELDRAAEVRRRAHQAPPLGQPLEHQLQVAVLQVAEAAVNQLRRLARGLRRRSRPRRTARRRSPRSAASRAVAAPVAPPPTTRRSNVRRREPLQRRRPRAAAASVIP